jgi:1-acyl-sn-glycerol-3-phosphate acyltransferase
MSEPMSDQSQEQPKQVTPAQPESLQLLSENSRRLRITRWITRAIGEVIFFRTTWKMQVHGLENVPRTGPVILLFNHITTLDPVAAGSPVRFRDPVPIGKIELTNNLVFRWLAWMWQAILIQRGEVDRTALKKAAEVIRSRDCLLIPPEGTRNKTGLRTPKEGFVMLATQTDAILVPVGVSGTEKFKNNIRHLRRTPITVIYGKPLRLKGKITRKQYPQVANEVMYQLATLIEPHLRGEYSDLSKMTMETIEYLS